MPPDRVADAERPPPNAHSPGRRSKSASLRASSKFCWATPCLFLTAQEMFAAPSLLMPISQKLKRTEAALRESEERLEICARRGERGNLGGRALETGEARRIGSERCLFSASLPARRSLMTWLSPACIPMTGRALRRVSGIPLKPGDPYRAEWRALLPDGSIRWLEMRGERRSISGKQVVGGLVQDINERKRVEQALCEHGDLLRSIIEHVPVPIMLSREDRKVLLINPAFTELTGYTTSDIPTRDEWEALAYRDDAPRVREDVRPGL